MSLLETFYEDVAVVDVPCVEQIDVCWEGVNRVSNRISDVHILGFSSKNKKAGNKYTYSEEAVREAAPLYEGIDVFVNHTKKDNEVRDLRDKIGFLEGVYFKEGVGLKGDLVLNEKHDFYEQFIWWADNRPSQIGLSHHAGGVFNRTKHLCESIQFVRSVDVVTKPATTEGLFESLQEGVIEESITEDKVKERFYTIIRKSMQMIDEQAYNLDSIQTRASAVRRIADNLATLMQDFTDSMSQLNPDNLEEQEEDMKWEDITLEALKEHREDLVSSICQEERVVLTARTEKLQESLKDVPEKLVTEVFTEQCLSAIDSGNDELLNKLVADRKSLAPAKPVSRGPVTTVKESHTEEHEDTFDFDNALKKYAKKGVK